MFPFSAKIISRFEEKGFKLVAMKLKQASKELLETHYEDLKDKKFFPGLIQYMSSGPVCPMVSFSASSCQAFDLLATATARTAKKNVKTRGILLRFVSNGALQVLPVSTGTGGR